MKYNVSSILLLSCFILGMSTATAQCNKMKKKKINFLLGAAMYDNSRSTDIIKHEDILKEQYQINLFKGVVYKLIFDVSRTPEDVVIKLHDIGNKRGPGKYELVFNSETAKRTKNGTYEITLEYPQKKLLVSYDVNSNTEPGCISYVLGYYFKHEHKKEK